MSMSGPHTPPPPTTTSTTSARVDARPLEIRLQSLGLLASASNYDFALDGERRRSARDLARLFHYLVKLLQPDLFIEAGAKDALASCRARTNMTGGRVVAFEANPYTHKRFSAKPRVAKANIEYLHLALSDQVGEVSFHVLANDKGQPSADGQGSLRRRVVEDRKEIQVTVRSTTLDTFFAKHAFERAAMWVDVEGALEMVLTGGSEVLRKVQLMIVEVEDQPVWSGQWLAKDTMSYLYEHGLVPIARDYQSRYLYNIVFARQDSLESPHLRHALSTYHSQSAHRHEPRDEEPSVLGRLARRVVARARSKRQ